MAVLRYTSARRVLVEAFGALIVASLFARDCLFVCAGNGLTQRTPPNPMLANVVLRRACVAES